MQHDLRRDIQLGSNPDRPFRRFLRACRSFVERRPLLRLLYRLFVALTGTAVVLLGIILIPLPGPGWLVVFVGLGILGTEFAGARRATERLKRWLTRSWEWWQSRRSRSAAGSSSASATAGRAPRSRRSPRSHRSRRPRRWSQPTTVGPTAFSVEKFPGDVRLVSVSSPVE